MGETRSLRRERLMRWLVDHAARHAVELGWDLSDFCDLAAKAYVRHMPAPPKPS